MADRDPEDRLEELEARVGRVEEELEQLRTALIRRFADTDGETAARSGGQETPRTGSRRPEEAGGVAARDARADVRADAPEETGESAPLGLDLERWVGENALLVAGLLALVAAAGFLLKHAFEQGWISPAVRVAGGLLAGGGAAAYGEWSRRSGLGRYGGAFVGGGAAVAYLSVWAASGPYAMVSEQAGVAALAVISLLVVASATSADEPLLASLGALGGFLAPVVLPSAAASADLLVAYAGVVAAGTGAVAAARGWRVAFGVAVAGFVGLPAGWALDVAHPGLLALYASAGGAAAVTAANRRGWGALRAVAFTAAWLLLLAAAYRAGWDAGWAILALAPVLAAPSLASGVRRERRDGGPERATTYLVLSAAGWAGASMEAAPPPLQDVPLVLLAALSAVYVVPAVRRRHPVCHAVAAGLLAWGVAAQATGASVVAGWAGVLVLSAWVARRPGLEPARWVGFGLGALAAGRLFLVDLPSPGGGEPALVGTWSLAFYATVAALALAAGPLWERGGRSGTPPEADDGDSGPSEPELRSDGRAAEPLRTLLWSAAGTVFLLGGTVEVLLWFEPAPAGGTALARDLSVSAFWLIYAGGLLAHGFWRERRGVRIAGLVVSGAAMVKIAFYDLTRLDALYRVASFLLLALVALAAARAYHRRGGATDAVEGPTGRTGEVGGDGRSADGPRRR